ncbi:hypothetical protein AMOR_35720 [Anaeromyxobacter oryzae]|uniref:1,4-alpha-glucan branching enzyme n=2 Tax=Anaeromyxobacter oryzae TaxID=2918170 RepID=A0ABM7WYJ1_9BACT|nr:hypothetical protein AMOR_35720 [Anaeromyxobacter oryzae]
MVQPPLAARNHDLASRCAHAGSAGARRVRPGSRRPAPVRRMYAFTEVPDMAQRVSSTTTDHDTIRRWAEERGGTPTQVASTARGDQTGIIRIDFPGYSGEGKLEPISWDEWFQKFDDANLAFVYEETTARGQRSSFNKLVGRETAQARAQGRKTSRRAERAGGSRGGGTMRARRTSGTRGRSTGRGARKTGSRGKTTRRGASTRTTSRRGTSGRRQASGAMAARTAGTRRGSTSGRGSTGRGTKGGSRSRTGTKGSRGTSRRSSAGRKGGGRSGGRGRNR